MNIEDKKTTTAKLQQDSDRAIAEFLAKGGVIQKIESGKSGYRPGEETNVWGRRVKTAAPVVEQDNEAE